MFWEFKQPWGFSDADAAVLPSVCITELPFSQDCGAGPGDALPRLPLLSGALEMAVTEAGDLNVSFCPETGCFQEKGCLLFSV